MLERAAGLPDVGQLRDDLEILAAHHRPVGSQGGGRCSPVSEGPL